MEKSPARLTENKDSENISSSQDLCYIPETGRQPVGKYAAHLLGKKHKSLLQDAARGQRTGLNSLVIIVSRVIQM